MNSIDVHIGRRIRMRCQELQLSHEDLAMQISCSSAELEAHLNGETRIGALLLERLCEILQVTPSFFFRDATTADDDASNETNVVDIQTVRKSEKG